MIRRAFAAVLLACLVSAVALAHHPFAVYFDPSDEVAINSKVTAFRFTNPHGLVVVEVAEAKGRVADGRLVGTAPFGRADQS